MISADEALQRLKEGNRRYVTGGHSADDNVSEERRLNTRSAQTPFAVILGCSDSRVPAEYVFDQGIGDLFVIRVAGNIAASAQIASVEFAISTFGTRLVVVLGHAQCGAIIATLENLEDPSGGESQHIRGLVARIRPAVQAVREANRGASQDEIVELSVRENVRRSMTDLQNDSAVISGAAGDGLRIVGAEYSLHTGEVEFFA